MANIARGRGMTKIYAGLASVAVAALLGYTVQAVISSRASDLYADCRSGAVAGGDIGGPFTLVDETGASVTDQQVITKPSLVYFGYTFCPDVCPLDNARNADAVDILEEKGFEVTPLFITIDPERDTPAVLADYTDNLHPRMIGLTGSADQIRAASAAYKTYYKKQDDGGAYYLMDHTTFTYLVVPGRGFVDFFTRDESADQMAARVGCFLS